jgi:hypothetical protein
MGHGKWKWIMAKPAMDERGPELTGRLARSGHTCTFSRNGPTVGRASTVALTIVVHATKRRHVFWEGT